MPRLPIVRSGRPQAVISAGVGSRILAHDRVLKVGRTVADLADAGAIRVEHRIEALA